MDRGKTLIATVVVLASLGLAGILAAAYASNKGNSHGLSFLVFLEGTAPLTAKC